MWAAGLEDAADPDHVHAAGGIELEGRHAAVSDQRSVHVHGAESPVLHGQPDGAVQLRPEHVHGAERRRDAERRSGLSCIPTASQDDVDDLAKMVAAAGPRADGGVRRVPEVRARSLHVPARLRAAGATATAWSTATARRSPTRASSLQHARRAVGRRSARSRTSSSMRGTSSASARSASSRSTSRVENITCCLWLAEGFTQYYGPLLLTRAGLTKVRRPAPAAAVVNGSGRQVRSAVQMSEHAPFADAAIADRSRRLAAAASFRTTPTARPSRSASICRSGTVTAGKLSLDDYMRLLWQRHGKSADA